MPSIGRRWSGKLEVVQGDRDRGAPRAALEEGPGWFGSTDGARRVAEPASAVRGSSAALRRNQRAANSATNHTLPSRR